MVKIIRAATVPQSVGFFRDVMLQMRAKGYEMMALSSPGDDLTKLNTLDGFRIFELPMERHISLIDDVVSLLRLTKLFYRERPYVVHSITPKAGLLCMIAAWVTRVPVRIHTFTGLVWPTATGLIRQILITADRIICACATNIIPEGEGVKYDLQQYITNKPMKVLGYGNVQGLDMDRFDPERFAPIKKAPDTFTFLYVGRVVGDKGINELVGAFSKLFQNYPKCRLMLVGNYEPELDPLNYETEQSIATLEAIETKGVLFDEDLLKAYVAADCFVLPSYREGFPNSVLEAGAMGLPCIVTDINGSREIITNEVNGLIVPSKDMNALYHAMEQMILEDNAREKMASHAREMIASRFERSFVLQCQIDYYDELLNNK